MIPNDFLPSIWGFYLNEAAIIKDGMVAANEALMAHCRRETVGYGLTGSGSAFYAVCEGSERQTTEWAVSELRKSHSSFAWYAAENLL
ncbi:MAG: hypothetical protein H3C43_12470 [Leptonema sp. (in: Bacteria)]|nr:hypothetical protein [Leptonema sp. (in: bacteria)]